MPVACSRFPCGMHSGGCSYADCINNGNRPMFTPAPGVMNPFYTTPAVPMGCICPPTSEQTCQNSLCPRKGHLRAAGSI